ncbi:unnamed protein product [Paramecium sonneborni]|uniref:Uncharacterized protein n=1 Tax=Paramecium sonneborni TaxID=65129 RepID=A0A8S1M6W3_9CILI|nr:unnamed protein product [Paramecium sonneborni]
MNQIQEEEFVALSRQQANQFIPSLESAYYGLVLQGKYLPKLNSSIITSEYLLGVLFESYYVPQVEEINIGVLLKPIKKLELIDELLKIQMNGQKWGIDLKHTPNKEWIVNVLKTLKPDHFIFKTETEIGKFDMKKFTNEQIAKIKELDLSMGKKSNVRRFFRISKEKQIELEKQRQIIKKQALLQKMKRKKSQIDECNKDIVQIEEKVTNIQNK